MLRDLAPVIERVVFARAVAPLGYAVGYRASGIPVRLATVMLPDGADALWRLEITTDTDVLTVSFPPAFVHAGQRRRARALRRRAASRPTRSTPTTATSPSGGRSPTC